ncbi:fructosamine kinase family protein [Streptomyces roseirectus]|uniref:Fructosamine kinase family protein n=1 Tax=Streptomyces roseirectus TaxID=2768066 RepID=A0A7H0I6X7_9ACTN|nr:fructosamine kinase family protein [Streptomyces roseirectus]QNP68543.1 fructosamine kinase family protein [Streptomyces roseirectus]
MDARLAVAARFTGTPARTVRPLSGVVAEVGLADGRTVIVKHADAPGAARAEAAGLRWLGEGMRVPVVHGYDEQWLVTDRVPPGRATAEAAYGLGRALAGLHACGAPAYGAAPPGGPREAYIGLAAMRNVPGDDWAAWYIERRVLPYLRAAVDQGSMDAGQAAVVERACGRLATLAGPVEPPARLHGDLWNGNVLWGADGHAWLIDPAAHGGHRETDLAMLQLFGCPHLERVLAGYESVAPLAEGWRERVGAHQLFPLMVHVVLFGGRYVEQVVGVARGVG